MFFLRWLLLLFNTPFFCFFFLMFSKKVLDVDLPKSWTNACSGGPWHRHSSSWLLASRRCWFYGNSLTTNPNRANRKFRWLIRFMSTVDFCFTPENLHRCIASEHIRATFNTKDRLKTGVIHKYAKLLYLIFMIKKKLSIGKPSEWNTCNYIGLKYEDCYIGILNEFFFQLFQIIISDSNAELFCWKYPWIKIKREIQNQISTLSQIAVFAWRISPSFYSYFFVHDSHFDSDYVLQTIITLFWNPFFAVAKCYSLNEVEK